MTSFKKIFKLIEKISQTKDGKELRFCQIISLAVGLGVDIWYIKDESLLIRLEEMYKRYNIKKQKFE